jgi:hypothetical protein
MAPPIVGSEKGLGPQKAERCALLIALNIRTTTLPLPFSSASANNRLTVLARSPPTPCVFTVSHLQASVILSSPGHHTPTNSPKPSLSTKHFLVHAWTPLVGVWTPIIHVNPSIIFSSLQSYFHPFNHVDIPSSSLSHPGSHLDPFVRLCTLSILFSLSFSRSQLIFRIHLSSPSTLCLPPSHLSPLVRIFTPFSCLCPILPFLLAPPCSCLSPFEIRFFLGGTTCRRL